MVGLFQGDGSLSESTRNRGKFQYEIAIRDRDIINKLQVLLEPLTTVKVTTRIRDTNFKDNYESIILSIYNKDFRDSLKEYMPTGKKSSVVSPSSNLDTKAYIRGLTDADGSMGLADTRCFWSLCTASEAVKDTVLADIQRVVGAEKKLTRNTRDNVYNIVLYNEDAQIYTDYLYQHSSIHIDRKYTSYKKVQHWVRTIPKAATRSKTWDADEDLIVLSAMSLEAKMKYLNRTASSIKNRAWRLK